MFIIKCTLLVIRLEIITQIKNDVEKKKSIFSNCKRAQLKRATIIKCTHLTTENIQPLLVINYVKQCKYFT